MQPKHRRGDAPFPKNGMYQCFEPLVSALRFTKLDIHDLHVLAWMQILELTLVFLLYEIIVTIKY